MAKLYKTFFFTALIIVSGTALAGKGWHLTIYNSLGSDVTLKRAGESCWYWNDITEAPVVIKNNSSRTLYTEEKNSGSCNSQKSIAGINFSGTNLDSLHMELKGSLGDFGPTIKTSFKCDNHSDYVGLSLKADNKGSYYDAGQYSVSCVNAAQEEVTIYIHPKN
ncbi:hypothetical protein [Musicola paradisiaca]|uniref:Uncharacterized protein n=1 Tax=Musicola paradisiaca (strain Ech703) TaxID=579405 RepID=C6CAS1_MUSP7|nr:hypothetical protein [Musicola paradisiaca]ACS84621.1 hypothetical protein Dd703_0810 [Musicola paradisiaca Ech703]